jgi:hypothetical protein
VRRATLDPKKLLEQLQAEHEVLRWAPLPPQEVRTGGDEQANRDGASLEYLHHHWALADAFEPTPFDSGLRKRFEALVGRLTYKVLGPYFRQERVLLSHAVQVIDDLDQRCTNLDHRLRQLTDEVIDRQVAEAENQAKLALWLHLDPPAATRAPGRPATSLDEGRGSSEP